jgi:hypothetical protein
VTLEILFVALGAFVGGFVNGLTGFGLALTAHAFWLHVIGPTLAAPLATVCAVMSQLQTLPRIWHDLNVRQLIPFIAGGLAGVPLGTGLLTRIDPQTFKAVMGLVLVCYSGTMLFLKPAFRSTWGGRAADGVVGLASGFLGGLGGISGVLPAVWAAFRGWTKVESRGVFQAFNVTILTTALISFAVAGFFTVKLGWLILISAPSTLIGVNAGWQVYRRLSDRSYHTVVLTLLLFAGATLLATS